MIQCLQLQINSIYYTVNTTSHDCDNCKSSSKLSTDHMPGLCGCRYDANKVTFIDDTTGQGGENMKTLARVQSWKDPTVSYETDLFLLTCDCGRPGVSGLPCAHLLAHAEAAGVPIHEVVHKKDRTAGWKNQYPDHLAFIVPSQALVKQKSAVRDLAGDGFVLKLPPVVRRGKGRPSKQKRKPSCLEGQPKKQVMTCSVCKREGHRKSKNGSCKNMVAP